MNRDRGMTATRNRSHIVLAGVADASRRPSRNEEIVIRRTESLLDRLPGSGHTENTHGVADGGQPVGREEVTRVPYAPQRGEAIEPTGHPFRKFLAQIATADHRR